MTIRHLRFFICVCKYGSVTKAAEELFVAQPAVSNTIADIEKHYNVVLFNRINQRLILTDEGKKLLIKAQEAVSAFEEFEMQAQDISFNPLIKVGFSITIGKQQMPNLIKSLKEKYENLNVQISINQTAVIESKILDGTLDFAFIQGKSGESHIKSKSVSSNRLIAVCSKEYDIPESVTLEELCKYDLLLREDASASREFLNHILSPKNITVTPIIESVSNQALISAALQGLGVTILPETLLESHLKKGSLRKINISDCEFTRSSYIIYHKNRRFNTFKKDIAKFCYNNFDK